jgi:thiamine biosynthesis protein ThiS
MRRMLVRLNGELRELPDATTVAGLLRLLGVKPARVSVLVNEGVLVRARHEEHEIRAGDAVDIVPLIPAA